MTASKEVLDLVRISGLSIFGQACMAAIAEGEAGDTMGRLYSGGELVEPNDPNIGKDTRGRLWKGSLDVFPPWKGAWLDNGDVSTAAGILQFVGLTQRSTWWRIVAQTKKSHFTNDHITNGWWLAQDDFKRRSGGMQLTDSILSDPTKIPLVHTYLEKTWPGGCDKNFAKRFANNLIALQAPSPVPQPLVVEVDPNAFHVSDGRGVTFILKGGVVGLLAIGASFIGLAACSSSPAKPQYQQVATTSTTSSGMLSGPLALPLERIKP